MTMISDYHVRAELPDKNVIDLRVSADKLLDARERAERLIRQLRPDAQTIQWRGHVAFVDCMPAEEAKA